MTSLLRAARLERIQDAIAGLENLGERSRHSDCFEEMMRPIDDIQTVFDRTLECDPLVATYLRAALERQAIRQVDIQLPVYDGEAFDAKSTISQMERLSFWCRWRIEKAKGPESFAAWNAARREARLKN